MKKIILLMVFISTCVFAAEKTAPQVVEIKVTENGFEPSAINVNSGQPVTLKVTRTTDATCATEILIKDKNVKKKLPLNKTVSINLGKLKKGNTNFTCGMEMLKGEIQVR